MMRQKAQKDRRFSVLWERVLKAVSVFAFNPSTLVGLVFLFFLMQFLGVNGSFYNDESSSSDVTSGYELSHTIGHAAAASSLAMLLLGNYFSRRIIGKGNSPKGQIRRC
jgi:heme/copper-type cytochrome/quinol oxidase subunit 1